MRRCCYIIGIGVFIGLLGTTLLSRYITSLLYGVKATDPWLYGMAAVIIATVGDDREYCAAEST